MSAARSSVRSYLAAVLLNDVVVADVNFAAAGLADDGAVEEGHELFADWRAAASQELDRAFGTRLLDSTAPGIDPPNGG